MTAILGADGKPLVSGGDPLVMPDGKPAQRSMEPGQVVASDLIAQVSALPSFETTLDDIAQWRARQKKQEVTRGQVLTVRAVQMAARWQREAREFTKRVREHVEAERAREE